MIRFDREVSDDPEPSVEAQLETVILTWAFGRRLGTAEVAEVEAQVAANDRSCPATPGHIRPRNTLAIQFFSRSAWIAAYSSRAARYSGLRRARLFAAWAAGSWPKWTPTAFVPAALRVRSAAGRLTRWPGS